MIVGLTGGIGSGKSTIASFFKEFNVAIYIADVEAKKLMHTSNAIKRKLIEEFGANAYQNNQLNKKYIADIVFSDKSKLNALNKIVHPEVAKHFQDFVFKNSDKEYILYENAILFESRANIKCDFVITVTAPLNTRIQRVVDRDGATNKEVLQRIKNQWKEEKKVLQSNYIIQNIFLKNSKIEIVRIHKILRKKHLFI